MYAPSLLIPVLGLASGGSGNFCQVRFETATLRTARSESRPCPCTLSVDSARVGEYHGSAVVGVVRRTARGEVFHTVCFDRCGNRNPQRCRDRTPGHALHVTKAHDLIASEDTFGASWHAARAPCTVHPARVRSDNRTLSCLATVARIESTASLKMPHESKYCSVKLRQPTPYALLVRYQ
jgi:hypothetical protein